jgi:hypothetical protein
VVLKSTFGIIRGSDLQAQPEVGVDQHVRMSTWSLLTGVSPAHADIEKVLGRLEEGDDPSRDRRRHACPHVLACLGADSDERLP